MKAERISETALPPQGEAAIRAMMEAAFRDSYDACRRDVREDTDPGLMASPQRSAHLDDTDLVDLLGPMI